jgi:hypothetical protein
MNPSALGWIKRYLQDYKVDLLNLSSLSIDEFYKRLRACGFIYGTNLSPVSQRYNEDFKLTQEELAKVNLFTALLIVYQKKRNSTDVETGLKSIVDFYSNLRDSHNSIFSFSWKSKKIDQELESILHQRVQTNDSFIQKNFSNIVTNALLFVDVLTFSKYLDDENAPFYASKLEELLVDTVYFAVKGKKIKGKYDTIIIKLLQTSLRYHEINEEHLNNLNEVDLLFLRHQLEKQYLIDVVCMTLYSDEKIDESEKAFVLALANQLKFSLGELESSIQFMYDFVEKNKADIYYFNISNPVKYFYDKTYRSVSVLIHRNRKRILQEVFESKELMHLIVLSTHRELDNVEKKKVKSQLLDIFKTIPSLTIFALPGGSLLLPIIIKMIPTILPSSFNENLKVSEKNIKKK